MIKNLEDYEKLKRLLQEYNPPPDVCKPLTAGMFSWKGKYVIDLFQSYNPVDDHHPSEYDHFSIYLINNGFKRNKDVFIPWEKPADIKGKNVEWMSDNEISSVLSSTPVS